MRFKQFLQEDASSQEKGLMVSKPSDLRKPSDGPPFVQYLSSLGPLKTGGAPAGAMMMKKKMRKMKST
jgi:hypothetical protein